jgi:threonine synthase
MSDLKENKKYSINSSMKKRMDDFKGYFATEKETKETIKEVFDKYNYLMDPHTAVAYNAYNKYLSETGDQIKTLILSTASPFKFPKSVAEAIGINEELADFDLLNAISEQTNTSIPENIKALKNKEEIHNKNIKISDMEENILKILNI